jgi:HSP20 family protein
MIDTRAAQDHTAAQDRSGSLLGAGRAGQQRIPVNMYETTDALVIVAPMPGVRSEDVEVIVDGNEVTMRATLRTAAPKEYILHEWEYGLYERVLELPGEYGSEVTATLGHGQLAVRLLRGVASQPTTVNPVEPSSGSMPPKPEDRSNT